MPGKKAFFGPFAVDPESGEVRKQGHKVRLQEKPFQILVVLLERAGELVPREELHEALWPDNHFVEFDHNLNNAINKLREALNDSPEEPRYLETVPRKGYRFIGRVSWNGQGQAEAACVTSPTKQGLTRANKRGVWLAVACSTVVLLLASFAALYVSHGKQSKIAFQARDWVLITDFDNRTGEPVLNGSLEYAVERELDNSQFVNVVPRVRVNDVLALMRKPLDSKIDPGLGREICLRDGGIRAMLAGRVEKLGSTYTLSAQLLDPTNGVAVASLSEDDPADSQMAGAVHRLSNRVREKLGEQLSLIQQSEANLEKVTTPSLKALQLYTHANQLMVDSSGPGRWDLWLKAEPTAEKLLKQVIQEDPNFASAYILLAWSLKNQEKPDKEYLPYAKRAFELSEQTSERERYFIQGSYYEMLHQFSQATASYEALLRLFPDHYWETGNLTDCYRELDRQQERWRLLERLADLRPSDPGLNMQAASLNVFIEKELNAARPYLERAKKAVEEKGVDVNPQAATFVKLFPIYEHWRRGDIRQAHDELVQLDSVKGLEAPYVGLMYLPFGELKEAERHILAQQDMKSARNDLHETLALVAFARGDSSALKRNLQQAYDEPDPGSYIAVLMVHAGLWDKVERGIRKNTPTKPPTIIEGEFALARNKTAKGISLLEEGLSSLLRDPWHTSCSFIGFEDLAEAYVKQGKHGDAVRVLEESSKQWNQNYFGPGGTAYRVPMWMKNQMLLAGLYRKMGREQDAKKIEDELSNLLMFADSDHPILRELQKRNRPTTATSSK